MTGTNFTLGSLRLEHAQTVLAHSSAPRLHESSDNRLAYICDLLKHNPSICAYDDVSGKPLSWGLMLHDGAYGFAYTVPEARNKQVFALVAVHSVQQMTSHGVADLFGYAAVANRNIHINVTFAQFMALLFLEQSNQTKCRLLLQNLSSQHSLNND